MTSPCPHPAPASEFATLVRGLDSALTREIAGLRAFEEVAAEAVSARLGDGVAFALEEVRDAVDLVRQARDLVAALSPHEEAVRALLGRPVPAAALVTARVAA